MDELCDTNRNTRWHPTNEYGAELNIYNHYHGFLETPIYFMGDLRFLNGLFCCSLVCLRGRLGRPETLASHGLEDVHQ